MHFIWSFLRVGGGGFVFVFFGKVSQYVTGAVLVMPEFLVPK